MVVLYSKEGQLANRLWQAAHFIANAIEYDYRLLYLGLAEYSEHFKESINNSDWNYNFRITDGKADSVSDRLLFQYIRLSQKIESRLNIHLPFIKKLYFLDYSSLRYNIAEPLFLKLCKNNIVLVDGWFYEDKQSLLKHADVIRHTFKPNQSYMQHIEQLKNEQFINYDAIVGVHIRRGDYKDYNNGIWFYSNEEYIHFMDQVLQLKLFENKTVAFLICSNEELNYEQFHRFNIIIPTKHFVENLYALSLCDYIIGPPSTFTAWASFYGKVPLLHLFNKGHTIREELFSVIDYAY